MKKIYLIFMTGVFAFTLSAGKIDLSQSHGTDQDVVAYLQPSVANIEVDANVTIKAAFKEPLNERILRKAVIVKKLNEENAKSFLGFRFGFGKKSQDERIDGKVSYDSTTNTIIFQPTNPLKPGYYEVSYRHLMKKVSPKRGMKRDIKIKNISYRFYVPEVINGYKLPPAVDQKENDATLLGIDANNNGIRDDVERWIIKTYKDRDRAVTAIGFQRARGFQEAIRRNRNALPTDTYLGDALDCMLYFDYVAEEFGDKKLIYNDFGEDFENLILNTKSRVRAYLEYDRQFSGGTYMLTPASQKKSKCSQEVLELVGGAK